MRDYCKANYPNLGGNPPDPHLDNIYMIFLRVVTGVPPVPDDIVIV